MSQLGHLPSPGEKIDRYTVLAELAHGGMAAVFAVGRTIAGFDKVFAMKVMLPHLVSEERFVHMFLDEARIAANVQHPNVVQVFDVGNHRRTPYLVMEYLAGQSLSAIRRRVRLPPAAYLEILAAAAEGLHAAHETSDRSGQPLNIVHRDVSPQNIHVSYDGSVKVVDFGIAAAAGRMTQTRTGEVKGKFGYAAPEQLRSGRAIDRRLDLWALGVVAYEVLSGQRLFRGESDADTMFNVLKKEITPLQELAPNLPSIIYEVVHECLERSVELRPVNARELAKALRQGAAELGAVDQVTLGELIGAEFSDERAVEKERVAQAIGQTPLPIRDEESGSGRPHVHATNAAGQVVPSVAVPVAPRPGNKPRAIFAGIVISMGAAGFYALADEAPEPEPEPTPIVADEAPEPSTPAALPTPVAVEGSSMNTESAEPAEPDEEPSIVAVEPATPTRMRRRRRRESPEPGAMEASPTMRSAAQRDLVQLDL